MNPAMPGMSHPEMPAHQPTAAPEKHQSIAETTAMEDKDIWQHILDMKMEGVRFHMASMAVCKQHHLKGFAKMHKYHAQEELHSYLHIIGDCIEYLNYMPLLDFSHIHHMELELHGRTIGELMECSLEEYEEWEDETYDKLKDFRHQLHETKEHIEYLIKDVRAERQFIHELWAEMEKCEYEEEHLKKLDETLYCYFKKKMG